MPSQPWRAQSKGHVGQCENSLVHTAHIGVILGGGACHQFRFPAALYLSIYLSIYLSLSLHNYKIICIQLYKHIKHSCRPCTKGHQFAFALNVHNLQRWDLTITYHHLGHLNLLPRVQRPCSPNMQHPATSSDIQLCWFKLSACAWPGGSLDPSHWRSPMALERSCPAQIRRPGITN